MLQCMEIPGYKAPFTARQAASRKYPLQFLCDLAYAVLDNKTGDPLEYCHLMKHPTYKDVWTKSFGKEIHHLATTMETIFFNRKEDIPSDRKGDETYVRIVSVFRDGKKDKYRTRVTMGGNLVNFPGDCGTPTATWNAVSHRAPNIQKPHPRTRAMMIALSLGVITPQPERYFA